jgi:hypothetical protein
MAKRRLIGLFYITLARLLEGQSMQARDARLMGNSNPIHTQKELKALEQAESYMVGAARLYRVVGNHMEQTNKEEK